MSIEKNDERIKKSPEMMGEALAKTRKAVIMPDLNELNTLVAGYLKVSPVPPAPKVEIVPEDAVWPFSSVAAYEMGTDTIYVREGETITNEILVHELAHSVLAKYSCGTILSKPIQEIVAGYVEYTYRKNQVTGSPPVAP